MAEMRLTGRQQEAVSTRGKDILVSAAAGSGKTSVLARRIVSLIEEGADIRRMLVCTFTNLAAAEMRERIGRELLARAEETKNARLAAQAEYVQLADICTIHKFAIKVVRENAAVLGVPAEVRVGSEEESSILRDKAMEDAFTELYEAEDADFLALRDKYAGRTDKALKAQILSLYAFCSSRPEGLEWLRHAAEADGVPALLEVIRGENWRRLNKLEDAMEACCRLGEENELPEKQQAKNQADLQMARELKEAFFAEGFAERIEGCKIPSIERGISPEPVKKALQELKATGRKMLGETIVWASDNVRGILEIEAGYMREQAGRFYRAARLFQDKYAARKAARKIMDYDDMILGAYALLQDDALAAAYAARYDYVFIDEYQDTNPIQEALLSRVSREGNRFMVGDIKQSIYRFRLADPLIFLKKAREFEGERSGRKVIRMNENFRSAPGVVAAVNAVMERLMSREMGEIDYDEKERLLAMRPEGGECEILLTDADEEAAEGEAEADAATKEAHTLARRVLELIGTPLADGRPAEYGDICVLMRSTKGMSGIFGRVFGEYGIPVETPEGKYVPMSEVDVFVNLLKVIDNANSDIALLSVLRSHIGGFDEAEMAMIRAAGEEGSFAACFLAYQERQDALAKKCRGFMEKIQRFRLLAAGLSLGDLLITLKNETAYAAHIAVQPGGGAKAANFRIFFEKLLEMAAQQESLFSLVTYLEELKRLHGAYFEPQTAEGRQNCVRILSIHKSKGLEFPIVILARMSGKFNRIDLNDTLLLHSELGLASDMVDEEIRVKRPALTKKVFRLALEREMKSEELRILYVAMTRARERLILSGIVKEPDTVFARLSGGAKWYDFMEMSSFLDWVLAAVLPFPCMADWSRRPGASGEACAIAHRLVPADTRTEAKRQEQKAPDVRSILLEAGKKPYLPFYSYDAEEVPVKIGVSSILEKDGEEPPVLRPAGARPKFSGARLGTLIHLFMQHLDFSARTAAEAEAQMEEMCRRRLISPEECRVLKRQSGLIAKFLMSDMAYRIRRSPRVLREVPFSLGVPAYETGLFESGETVVVQGIIDLLFREGEDYILIDYKSNMVNEENLGILAEKYKTQLHLYEKAVEQITGRSVREKYLYFLRGEAFLRLF
ncbi:UvrD-helicase domain-containing protein [Christensenellaceae bacterium NSJ-63]|uniref:DNA 3'-5' helicase n=1 Tax=Guopingia tenuis TaxID=2763656 RepID=A0A926DK52_9FIRM|nr:UvrD-helicase domain-containing protein [Guopingia tenuis]MBC8538590.1 UvrD-helicase domain-containing protein [Guopingia tenuis]